MHNILIETKSSTERCTCSSEVSCCALGEIGLGLQDMGGNVWEWTDSWFRPYSQRSASFTPASESEKLQRGGPFQCDECLGFRVYTRSHSTPETSLFLWASDAWQMWRAEERRPVSGRAGL